MSGSRRACACVRLGKLPSSSGAGAFAPSDQTRRVQMGMLVSRHTRQTGRANAGMDGKVRGRRVELSLSAV